MRGGGGKGYGSPFCIFFSGVWGLRSWRSHGPSLPDFWCDSGDVRCYRYLHTSVALGGGSDRTAYM